MDIKQVKQDVKNWLEISIPAYKRETCPFINKDGRSSRERYKMCRTVFPEMMKGWLYYCEICPCQKFGIEFVIDRAIEFVQGDYR